MLKMSAVLLTVGVFLFVFVFYLFIYFQKVSASIETITTSVFKSLSLRSFRDV